MNKIFHLILITFLHTCLGISASISSPTNSKPDLEVSPSFRKAFFASDPTKTTISGTPTVVSANGVASATITVQVKDNLGNNVVVGGETVTLSSTLGNLTTVVDNNNGTYQASLTSTTSGYAIIFGTLNGAPISDNQIIQFTPGPSDATKSVISATPSTIEANGIDNSTITVQAKDAFGNNVTSGGDNVTLTTTIGSVSSVIDNGDGTYTASINSTVSGFANIKGKLNGVNIGDNEFVQLEPGPPSAAESTVNSNPDSIVANGVNTSFIFVQLKDSRKNNLTTGGESVTLQTSVGSLTSVIDYGDGTYSAKLTAPTTTGTAFITAKLNGVDFTDDAQVVLIPGPPHASKSTISALPTSITADGLSTSIITIQVKDVFGNNLNNGGDNVTLSASKGTLTSITDNGNGTYTASLTSTTKAETSSISGELNGVLIPDEEEVLFVPGAADLSLSTITSSKDSITADGTSNCLITIDLIDVNGNHLITGGETVTVTSNLGTFSSIQDHSNGTYTATFTSGILSGKAIIKAQLNGSDLIDKDTVILKPGPPNETTSLISATPTLIIADGVSTANVLVQLKDVNSNNILIGGETVLLSTTLGSLSSVTDNNNGTYSATLTSSTSAGKASISGKLNGLDITDNEVVNFLPGDADPTKSTINALKDTILANGVSTTAIHVQLKDVLGNNLTTGGDIVVLATNLGTISAIVDNNNGSYDAILTSSTTSGTSYISGSVNGYDIVNNDSVVFKPGTPDITTSTLSTTSDSIIADGSSFAVLSVQLKDEFGNDIKTGGENVEFLTTLGTLTPSNDNGNGSYTSNLTSTTFIGQTKITAKVNGLKITDEKDIYFVPGPADTSTTIITASPSNILANGISKADIFIQLFDKQGNKITDSENTIELFSSIGALGSLINNNNGTFSCSITSTTAGFAVISGKLNGKNIADNEVVQVIPGNPSTDKTIISAKEDSIIANGSSTSIIEVQLKDAYGNDLTSGGHNVELSTTHGNLSAVVDHSNGKYSATLTAASTPGLAIITGKLNTNEIASKDTVYIVTGKASTLTSTISSEKDTILADGLTQTLITVQLKDEFGNNVTHGNDIVELITSLGTLSSITNNNDGSFSLYLTSAIKSGTAIIKGKLNGAEILDNSTVYFKHGDVSLSITSISANPNKITADGVSSSVITVELKDKNGNKIPYGGDTITIMATKGTLSPITDHGNGSYSANLTSTTIHEIAILSGTFNGKAIIDTAKVTFVPGAPDKSTSVISASPTEITADGESISTIILQLKDVNGNNVNKGGDLVQLFSSKGDLSFPIDNNNGTYTAFLTSTTTTDTATITGKLNGNLVEDTAMVAFVPGAGDIENSTIIASPDTIEANGLSTSTITIQLIDKYNNLIKTGGENIFLTTTLGSVSEAIDQNNGSYTAILTAPLKIGTATVKAKLNGVDLKNEARVVFVPGTADPTTSFIKANPKTIVANGTSTSNIMVVLKDKNSNLITSGNNEVSVFSSLGTISNVINNSNGTYQAILTSSFSSGKAIVTGKLNNIEITNIDTVAFTPGLASANKTTINSTKKEIIANGLSTSTIIIKTYDEFGNALTTGGDTIILSTTAGNLDTVIDKGNGSYEAVLTSSTELDTATITGLLNFKPLIDKALVYFIPDEAESSKTTIDALETELVANGVSSTLITVRLYDKFNHPISKGGDNITLSTTLGDLSSITDNNNGTYSSTLTSSTKTGIATITGRHNGVLFENKDTVKFVPEIANVLTSKIETADDEIVANGTSITNIIVTLYDQYGNKLTKGGENISLSTSMGTLGSVADNNNGTYSSTLTAGTKTGKALIAAKLNNLEMHDSVEVNFIADKASVLTSAISANHHQLVANGISNAVITVELFDVNNNPLKQGGDIITLQTNAGTLEQLEDLGNGSYTTKIISPKSPALSIIGGFLNGIPMVDTTSINFFEDIQPNIAFSTISVSDSIIVADGQSTSIIMIKLFDQNGNKINNGGYDVDIFSTAGLLSTTEDLGNGNYTALLTSSNEIETAKITGQIRGQNIIDYAHVFFVLKDDLVKVPEGFSPNGDNVNDQFRIIGIEKMPNNTLQIYNRWGTLVYKTSGYQNTWEGHSEGASAVGGEKLPAGTYFYILELNNEIPPKSGFFYLKR